MTSTRSSLNAASVVTLDASGNGVVRLGPDDQRGPANWRVDGVILTNGRPGQAPIPRVQIYLDTENAAGRQGLTYDGSFSQGRCNIYMVRGQNLIAVWAAGLPGDQCEFTVTGEKW